MNALTDFMTAFNELVFYPVNLGGTDVPIVVLVLIISSVIFTLYFKFINIRAFGHSLKLIRGDYSDPEKKAPGEISHFQALATAISGTVGVGNIGAVALAICRGGPGACFWIIVAGLFGMTTKFVECTLGVKYRQQNKDGTISGGPMFYLDKGIGALGFKRTGKTLGTIYAIGMTIGCLGIGNMFQANQAFSQFVVATGGENSYFADKGLLFGAIIAFLVALVIIGGIKSIARVTSKLVPIMAVAYLIGALAVILLNAEYIPKAIDAIFTGAFTPQGIEGGMIFVLILAFQRAVFSNEAGIGSSSIAHSAVRTDHPVTEGIVGLMEPFIDTVVICTLTALVIITTMVSVPEFNTMITTNDAGIRLTSQAFAYKASWSPYFLSIVALLFCISTMLTWSYYGLNGWRYIVGHGKKRDIFYNLFFCCFILIGCVLNVGLVIDFSDALIWFVCIPNIIGLYFLAPIVKKELKGYLSKLKNKEIVSFRKK